MAQYDDEFYANRHAKTKYAAETILLKVLGLRPSIASAVDIGCGVGTWLSVLRKHGVEHVQGVDGPWVDHKHLEISALQFRSHDFRVANGDIAFDRRYDLAICLEVAEHIEASKAAAFVKNLTKLSDTVLFSAAIPGQGGVGHINEQWPQYWVELFAENGYVANDSLRGSIWNDDKIPYWYRQNVLLFISAANPLVHSDPSAIDMATHPIVHPVLFAEKINISTREAFVTLLQCLSRAVKRRLTPHG